MELALQQEKQAAGADIVKMTYLAKSGIGRLAVLRGDADGALL